MFYLRKIIPSLHCTVIILLNIKKDQNICRFFVIMQILRTFLQVIFRAVCRIIIEALKINFQRNILILNDLCVHAFFHACQASWALYQYKKSRKIIRAVFFKLKKYWRGAAVMGPVFLLVAIIIKDPDLPVYTPGLPRYTSIPDCFL